MICRSFLYRPSDRVRKNIENYAAFFRGNYASGKVHYVANYAIFLSYFYLVLLGLTGRKLLLYCPKAQLTVKGTIINPLNVNWDKF